MDRSISVLDRQAGTSQQSFQTARTRFIATLRLSGAPVFMALAYYLGAQAAFSIGTLSDRIFAPFWPPNIILFCALALVPKSQWWIYIAAAFPAHVIAEPMPAAQSLVAFGSNCLVAILSAL